MAGEFHKGIERAIEGVESFWKNIRKGDYERAIGVTYNLPRNYRDIARRVVNDMATLGALQPGTAALIRNVPAGEGVGHLYHGDNKGNERRVGQWAQKAWKGSARGLPAFTGDLGEGGYIKPWMRASGMSKEDFVTQSALSSLTRFMDPESQRAAREYLARESPQTFQAYRLAPTPEVTGIAERVDPKVVAQRLAKASAAVDPNELMQGIRDREAKAMGVGSEAYAPVQWLRDYMQAAQRGLGGTRAQQQFAKERLATLEREAEEAPQLQNLRTFAENLVNPVAQRASLSNILGQRRVVDPRKDEYRRGGFALRNPTAV